MYKQAQFTFNNLTPSRINIYKDRPLHNEEK